MRNKSAVLLAMVVVGCAGRVEDAEERRAREPDDLATGGAGGARPPAASGPKTPSAPPATCAARLTPAPAYLRRLTNDEYLRSAGDVLRLVPSPADDPAIARGLVTEGFGNEATALNVSPTHVQRYAETASRLASLALDSPERRMALAGCETPGTEPCLTNLIRTVGRRAFRRSLRDEEVARLRAVAATGASDPLMPARLVVQALLQSPKFLYRAELGVADAKTGWRRLQGHEVASRLSYFLWGTTPDDGLLAAAEAGQLEDAAAVRARAEQMLDAPTARRGVHRILSAWLELYELDEITRAAAEYPAWSEALRASMREETSRFLADFALSKQASLLDALTAGHSFVDDSLAKLYGVTAPGTGWRRVDFPAASERGGLLTHAGLLASSASGGEVTAPILRGRWVREVLLCSPPPPPPPDIPPVPTDPGLTLRQRLEQHRSNPSCTPCHKLLDPVGLAFEQYDLIGRFRATGAKGEKLTGEGQLVGVPGDPVVRGPKELAALVRQQPETAACVVKHVFSFAHGRVPTDADSCAREEALAAFRRSGFNLRALVMAVVASDAFRHVSEVR